VSQARPLPPKWREVFSGPLGSLTFGLFLMEVLAAVQILVVTTVMPAVVADLGGLRFYGWAFSAAGLATVITIPLTGQIVDRVGPLRPLVVMLGVFAAGTVVAGLAPSMPVFIAGRFLQGAGTGSQFAVGLGTVAKVYPDGLRPRVFALLAAAWVLPGLAGPSYGALLASTIGWRWAFLTILPMLLGAGLLVIRGMARVAVPRGTSVRLDLRRPVQLSVGSALVLAGLTHLSPWSVPIVVGGVALAGPALRGLVARGSSVGRPGLGMALVCAFLLTLAFFGVDGFVPLLLTRIRGRTVAEASVVVTLATVGWSLGTWWQSRAVAHTSRRLLFLAGTAVIAAGAVGVAAGLLSTPLVLPYAAWTAAGLGMGVAYPTIYLVMMDRAGAGYEGTASGLMLLVDSLGVSVGAGLGGSAVAIVESLNVSLRIGLAGAFGLALAAAIALIALAPRLGE
jgi:MFS family permease